MDPEVRAFVGRMQRDAFELPEWDPEARPEHELEPPAARPARPRSRCPTLVLVGELDQPATLEAANRIAAEVAGARLVVWPDAAHMLTLERPDEFERLALDFLAAAR